MVWRKSPVKTLLKTGVSHRFKRSHYVLGSHERGRLRKISRKAEWLDPDPETSRIKPENDCEDSEMGLRHWDWLPGELKTPDWPGIWYNILFPIKVWSIINQQQIASIKRKSLTLFQAGCLAFYFHPHTLIHVFLIRNGSIKTAATEAKVLRNRRATSFQR